VSALFISEKDLLKAFNISACELYRWKQEGIIPDAWFIKMATEKGQEIFFPKDKIIRRIKTIKKLQKHYSLQDLANILLPGMSEKIFSLEELNIIEEVSPEISQLFVRFTGKNNFTFVEVVVMAALTGLNGQVAGLAGQLEDLVQALVNSISRMKSTRYVLVLFEVEARYFAAICAEMAGIFPDSRINIIQKVRLSSISNLLKIKYNRTFNFGIDTEIEDTFA